MPNKTPTTTIFVVILVLLAGGLYLASKHHAPIAEVPNGVEPTASSTSTSNQPLTYLVKGSVDTKEVGGTGLTVLDGMRVSMTTDTGVFAAMPLQKDKLTVLVVNDSSNKVRAYAVAFPETQTVTIDARTTAEATLIDPTADLATAHKELTEIDNLKCFPAYVSYLQQQLPIHNLDDIKKASDAEGASNPHNMCVAEIQALVKTQ